MKYLVVIILLVILGSLGSAMIYLFKGDESGKMVKALTWRVGLSIFLICLLAIGASLGWISPHTPGL